MTTYFTQHPQGDKTMTLELEMQLRDMGILPATMLGELQAVADTKHIYPDMLVKNYFNDPRDENGEVPFWWVKPPLKI